MSFLGQFQAYMATLGPLVSEIEHVTEGPEGDEWRLDLEDGSVIEIEYDEARERIAVSADLGPLPHEHRAHTCEMLLTFNLLWQDELPARMAIGSPGEHAVQVAELPATAFEPTNFHHHLSGFLTLAARWRRHVANGCQAMEDPTPHLEPRALRV